MSFVKQRATAVLRWTTKVGALVWHNVWIRRLRRQFFSTVLEVTLAVYALTNLPPGSRRGAARQQAFHERELPPPEELHAYDVPTSVLLHASVEVTNVFVDYVKHRERFANESKRKIRLFLNGHEEDRLPAGFQTKMSLAKMPKVSITRVDSEDELVEKCSDLKFDGVCARVTVDSTGTTKGVNYSCYIPDKLPFPMRRLLRSGFELQPSRSENYIWRCQRLVEGTMVAQYANAVPAGTGLPLASIRAFSQRFPVPAYPAPESMDNAVATLCFLVVYMMPFCRSVWSIVEENSSGMATTLRAMGTTDLVYWLAHFISVFVHVSAYSVIMLGFMVYYTPQASMENVAVEDYQRSLDYAPYLDIDKCDKGILFMLFTLVGVQMALHAMTFSGVVTKPILAMVLAFFYWAGMFVMSRPWGTLTIYLFGDGFSKYAGAAFPVNMLYLSFFHIRWTIFFGRRADLRILFRKAFGVDNVTLGSVVLVAVLCCVLQVFLFWYLAHVLPSLCDYPLQPAFLFTGEYWLGKRSKVLEVSSPELPKAEVEELPEGLTVVVEAERVYKDYSRIKAVHNVSLKALDNQITAILGLTGAGKTTLIRLFAGIVAPTTGRVTVCGQDTVLGRAFIRTVASFCPRKAVFSADLTVWEHLMLFAAIKGVSLREMSTRAKEVLAELEFHEKLHSFPHLLTENAKKRLLLAIALLSRPRVLFLDEPTELLDEEERREVWDLLGNMRDRCAIILTTSLTEEADMLGDRVAIMSHGRLRCCGTPTFLKKSHGTGYEIRFPNNDDVRAIEQDLLAIVRGRTAQARILHTPRDVIISLGIKDTRGFPDMFKRLEDTCRQHGIKGMRVTVSTLEDVFLKMSTETDDVDVQIDSDIDTSELQAFLGEPPKAPSILGQVKALLGKRYALLATDWAQPLGLYLLFFSTVFVMEYLQWEPGWLDSVFGKLWQQSSRTVRLTSKHANDTSPALDLGQLYEGTTTFLRGKNELSDKYYRPLISGVTSIAIMDSEPTHELDRLSWEDFIDYSQNWIMGADFSIPANPKTWWNPYMPYSKTISTSLMNSALLRKFSGDPEALFRITLRSFSRSNPNPFVHSFNYHVFRDTSAFVERGKLSAWRRLLLPPVVSLVGAAFALAPIAECAAGSKRLQLMTGVSGFVYWLSHYIFDGLLYAAFWVTAAAAFVLYNRVRYDTAVALLLLLVTSYPMVTGLAYLESFSTSSSGISFAKLFVGYTILATQAVTMHAKGNLAYLLLSMLPPFGLTSGLVKLLHLDRENQFCDAFSDAAHGGPNTLQQACSATVAERKPLDYSAIDICCQNREASAQGPYTLNPFSLHFLGIGVNLLIHVVEGAFMFTVLAFLDSGTLMTLRNTLAEKAQILRAEFDSDIQQESQKAPRLAKVAGLEQHALVVCDVWRTCAKNAVPELKAINLSLRQGECFGLLGAHNARKTVLLEVLSGLATHSAGDAYSQKFVLSQGPRKWQSQIGYCPQQDCLLSNLTVQDHLVLFARLRGLPGGRLRDYVNNMLKTFRLQEKGRECPRDMSLSDKRKLSLAIALTGTPSLVFLDEPLQGVDAVTHQRLYQVIQHLCKKSKTTFLYASTGMRQLELMCKRLAIIVDGHLQCIGTIDHLREKFGQGMTVKIQLSGPEKERVLEVQPVMTALFPDSRLIYYHRGLLSFEMYEKRPWSEVFSSISLLLQGFRCDYVLVSETMLEDIYLAFSKSYYHGTTNRPRSVF